MALPQNPGMNNRGQQVPQQKPSVFGSDPNGHDEDDWGDEFAQPEEFNTPPQEAYVAQHTTPSVPAQNQGQPSVFQDVEEINAPSPSQGIQQPWNQADNPPNQGITLESNQMPQTPFSQEIEDSIDLLLQAISDDGSTEVIMNGPNEVMMKRDGVRYHMPEIRFHDKDTYHRVINEVVLPYTDTQDRIDDESYLVEGQLELPSENDGIPPMLARVFIITPPAVPHAKVTIAKKSRYALTLDDIQQKGAMTPGMSEFIKALSLGRVCMVFSGLSGAGKTTMLEATTHHFDQNDRVIVIEDTPELRLPIADTVYMVASSNRPGADPNDRVTMEWLVKATNRMRADRIVVGEVRGPEMSDFLVAANSGADGSMLTIHADNPRKCLDKILSLVMRSEGAKSENAVRRDIASTVQVVIQLGLIDGKHRVTHIEEISNIINQNSGLIASTTIFEYDRNIGRHVPRNRPSEELTSYLAQRGVALDSAWFR